MESVLRASMFALACCALAQAQEQGPTAFWAEGEAFFRQVGSRPPDRPPYASRGQCLGSGWGGRKGHYVLYRFRLKRGVPRAWLYVRYARKPASDSHFEIRLDRATIHRRIAFASTAGWGHLRHDEWAYREVSLGRLAPGRHALEFVSLAHKNNTNVDGFFIAVERFSPPNTRKEIEMSQALDCDSDPNRPTPETVDEALALADFLPRIGDWHYPLSEAEDRAALRIPVVVSISDRSVELQDGENGPIKTAERDREAFGWRVAEILTDPQPLAVLEREFAEWGLMLYIGTRGVAAEVRKAVGRLDQIAEPHVRLPKDYYEQLAAAREDVLGAKVLADAGDPSYDKVVGFLPACHAYTFVGTPQSERKYIVGPDGRVGEFPAQWGKDKDYVQVFFDPCKTLGEIEPTVAKRGLLGGSLPAVNMGFYDAESKRGWEQCVFAVDNQGTKVFMRLRELTGKTAYWQLDPLEELPDGKAFYAALLALRKAWDGRFAQAMRIEAADRRVVDASRAGITIALTGCVGLQPKYGMGGYWGGQHDTFPPTTLSLVEALVDWGLHDQARARLGHYLDKFIKPDGSIDYYGPAVSEYGQFLALTAKCVRHTGDLDWLDEHRGSVDRLCAWVLREREASKKKHAPGSAPHGLIFGSPEADTRKETNYYFSGDCWCWRGLLEIGNLFLHVGRQRDDQDMVRQGISLLSECEAYQADILRAAAESALDKEDPRFLPPIVGQEQAFKTMTQDRLASYTNYRYWLEALSAQCLGETYDRMMIDYRVARGGELLGMTRFGDHLDDWPFWHYAYAILGYDRVREYLLGFYGHMAHHQTRGTFTAYEQVPIRGYRSRGYYADYCVPSQLTIALMTRWMLAYEERDRDVLWLCRAVPREWVASGFAFSGASTRWGKVGVRVSPSEDLRAVEAEISFARDLPPMVKLRIRHPRQARLDECRVEGGRRQPTDAEQEFIRLKPQQRVVRVRMSFELP